VLFADGVFFFSFSFWTISVANGILDFSNFLKTVNDVTYSASQDPGKKNILPKNRREDFDIN
jgi:hypothetical protein